MFTMQTRPLSALIALFSLIAFTPAPAVANDAPPRVVFLGDSLTAGYGVSPEQAYPALIREKVAQAGLDFEIVPAGLSGETSAGGLRRVNWILQRPASVLVIALGSNDGLRGIELSDTRKNLQGIINSARAKYPDIRIIIAGMQMPPNLGQAYTAEFRELFPTLAETNDVPLIPFLIEGVGGNPELNIQDGIHPNPEGHKILAENVWKALEPVLRELQAGDGKPREE